MIRQILSRLLAVLIALQSVIAVADVHQLHQSDNQHIGIYLEHQVPEAQFEFGDSAANNDVVALDDCQHCCHCHGVCHPFVSTAQIVLEAIASGSILSLYQSSSPSHQASPDNPPPIS